MAEATLQRTESTTSAIDWQAILKTGLLAGGIIIFTGAIGMMVAFNEREVIQDWLTLGQILLFLPPIIAAFMHANHSENYPGATSLADENPLMAILSGLGIGIAASLPMLALVLLTNFIDVRGMFINIDRDLIEILTLDSESQFTGSLTLAGMLTVCGVIGAALALIPNKVRYALQTGIATVLAIGIMGELVVSVFERFVSDDLLDLVFERDSLLLNSAISLFVVISLISLLWAYNSDKVETRYEALPNEQQRNLKWGRNGFLLLVLLLLPYILGSALSQTMTLIGLYALMGLGLNIAIGLAGLLDLGYVTNFAVGAYVTAILTSNGPLGIADGWMSFWLVIPIATLAAMATGFIFALPVLKMRGDYLAIATLGFGEIIGTLAVSDALRPLIGGPQGVTAIPNPNLFGLTFDSPERIYYLYLAAGAAALFVSIRLNNSRIGRQWMSIREDEDVAAAMGINTARSKLLAFTLSAATGGLAGAVFAAQLRSVYPNSFQVLVSINVLSLIIIGGIGSIPGVIVGAVVLIGLPELLREFSDYRFLLYGALLVFMMVSRPEGLLPSQVTRRELNREAEETDVDAAKINDPTLNDAPQDEQATIDSDVNHKDT